MSIKKADRKAAAAKGAVKRASEIVAEDTALQDGDLEKVTGGIGSQSSGAGAGKVTFNPFSIK